MSIDQPLPKDPIAAADLLVALKTKDENDTICRYPTCSNPRQAATGSGRPSAYCENPEHTPVANHRARQQLRAAAAGTPVSKPEHPLPAVAPVESLRNSVVSRITQLQNDMERYLAALVNISDPDLSAAQIQASLDQADTRVAEVQQALSAERSLRLAADMARTAAQADAQAEREAAEAAIQRMEEAEARVERQREENERSMADIQAEHAEEMDRVRIETQHQIEIVEKQSGEALAHAQAATVTAEVQAKQADVRAHEALAQAATAERLVSEAHTTLERERAEIDRLRKEHAEAMADTRRRAETDRAEARASLERERAEIDRLRAELAALRKQAEQATARADKLATTNDELRGQLVQVQTKEREQPRRQ